MAPVVKITYPAELPVSARRDDIAAAIRDQAEKFGFNDTSLEDLGGQAGHHAVDEDLAGQAGAGLVLGQHHLVGDAEQGAGAIVHQDEVRDPDRQLPVRIERVLHPDAPIDEGLLRGHGDLDRIEVREVSRLVNNVRNNGPELIAPAEPGPEHATLL